MGNYYLDIETEGLDVFGDKIITIQYQELEQGTGRPTGELVILKEWEEGEEAMIQKFITESKIIHTYGFDFVPVGFNLTFEHKFLLSKSKKYSKHPIDIMSRPCIDLHSIAVLMNNGQFKGSGLDKLTGKPHSGLTIPQWYRNGQHGEIENYIKNEADEFIKLLVWLHQKMPVLRAERGYPVA